MGIFIQKFPWYFPVRNWRELIGIAAAAAATAAVFVTAVAASGSSDSSQQQQLLPCSSSHAFRFVYDCMLVAADPHGRSCVRGVRTVKNAGRPI